MGLAKSSRWVRLPPSAPSAGTVRPHGVLVTGPNQDVAPEGLQDTAAGRGCSPPAQSVRGTGQLGQAEHTGSQRPNMLHWAPSRQNSCVVWAALTPGSAEPLSQRLLLPAPTSAQARFIHTGNFSSHKVQELCLLLTSQLEASQPSQRGAAGRGASPHIQELPTQGSFQQDLWLRYGPVEHKSHLIYFLF